MPAEWVLDAARDQLIVHPDPQGTEEHTFPAGSVSLKERGLHPEHIRP